VNFIRAAYIVVLALFAVLLLWAAQGAFGVNS